MLLSALFVRSVLSLFFRGRTRKYWTHLSPSRGVVGGVVGGEPGLGRTRNSHSSSSRGDGGGGRRNDVLAHEGGAVVLATCLPHEQASSVAASLVAASEASAVSALVAAVSAASVAAASVSAASVSAAPVAAASVASAVAAVVAPAGPVAPAHHLHQTNTLKTATIPSHRKFGTP